MRVFQTIVLSLFAIVALSVGASAGGGGIPVGQAVGNSAALSGSVGNGNVFTAAAGLTLRPAGYVPFATVTPLSPFNSPAPPTPTYTGNSATEISAMLTGNGGNNTTFGKIQVSTHDLSSPTDDQAVTYTAHNTDPSYVIHCLLYSNCPLEGQEVHIPVGALPSANLGFKNFHDTGFQDQHLGVINADTGAEYDTYLTPTPNGFGGILNVGYGAYFPAGSNGVGKTGATAAGFALTVGRIRAVDLLAGRIPYALFLVTPCENGFVSPAVGSDAGPVAGCPPIGAHIWLDSTNAQIAASGADAIQQTILRALHEFGGYIGDRTGGSFNITLEGGDSYMAFGYQNPWIPLLKQYYPSEVTSGAVGEYHVSMTSGNIDLSVHLHVITN